MEYVLCAKQTQVKLRQSLRSLVLLLEHPLGCGSGSLIRRGCSEPGEVCGGENPAGTSLGPVPCKHQSSHGRNKLTQAGCSLSKDQTSVGHCFFRKYLSLRLVYWQDVKMGWIPKNLPSRQLRCDCARSFWAVPSHRLLSRTCNNSSQQKAFL